MKRGSPQIADGTETRLAAGAKRRIVDAAKSTAWGLALAMGDALIASFFARHSIAVSTAQAALVEWGTSHAGVVWTPAGAAADWISCAKRAARGAAAGASLAAAAVVASVAVHAASLAGGPRSTEVVLLGLALAVLAAVRDELLLRGLVLRIVRGTLPSAAAIAAGACAAGCARFGLEGEWSRAVAFDAFRGAFLTALWLSDGGAWTALGANVAFAWTEGSLARGGLFDVRFPGTAGAGDSAPAILVVALGALAASGAVLRPTNARKPQSPRA